VPSLEENVRKWHEFDWRQGGDEWSRWWGSPKREWRATIYPRIREHLPVELLVEIATGHGRWTQFLRSHCQRLIGFDLDEGCIAACRRRLADDERLTFQVNDGRSLPGVADRSAGFVFSFDSLVHVEQDVMDAYLAEVARVLTVGGVAFLHHSNLAGYDVSALEPDELHWRGGTVSADTVAAAAERVGLHCFRQELIPWGTSSIAIDCLSWISRADRRREVVENMAFMAEAERSLARATRWRRQRSLVRRAAGRLMRLAR